MSSPKISRSTLVRGAGSLVHGSTKLFAKEDIVATVEIESWKPQVSTHGEDAARISDATADITFTPSGRLTNEILNLLYPESLRTPVPGQRLFPAADVSLTIHGVDGLKVVFSNAFPIAMPALTLTPTETAIGETTFKALIKDNTSRETTGSFYTTTTTVWDETFDPTSIITCPYSAMWGEDELLSKEGFNLSFEVEAEAIKVDGIGTVDFQLKSVTAVCEFVPVNMSAIAVLNAMRPEGLMLGTTLRQGKDLVITPAANGGLSVTLFDAVMENSDLQWKNDDSRVGTVKLVASRELTGTPSALGRLFSISIFEDEPTGLGTLSITPDSIPIYVGQADVGTVWYPPNDLGAEIEYQWEFSTTLEGPYNSLDIMTMEDTTKATLPYVPGGPEGPEDPYYLRCRATYEGVTYLTSSEQVTP